MASSTEIPSSIPFISMISANKTGIWEYDLIFEQLSFVNDYFEVLNLDSNDVKFTTLQQLRAFIHPEDKSGFNDSLKTIQDSEGSTSTVKYRFVNAGNQAIWMESNLYSYQKNSEGKLTKIVSLTRNIQQEEEEKNKILKENIDYRNLLKAIPDFVFIFDENLIFQDIILPDGLKLFHNKEEIIGQHGSLIYSEEVCGLFINNIRECLNAGQLKEIEYPVDLFGVRYYYKARITPLADKKVFVLISDVSDRMKRMADLLEAKLHAEEADRMKTAFIANMSHEIRTPLNSIIGFTEIIATEEDPERKEEYLEIVHTNNNLLLQLISDILDLSVIESGKYEMNLTETNIHNLIAEVAHTYEFRMKPDVEFRVIYPASPELTVITDPNRVKQVLFNFLSNAVKNTMRGMIAMGVEEQENSLRFYVSDTGCGIPDDKFKTIFNRFEKLDSFMQGTGLGLSIAESLVQHLGGKITVESQVGVGSTFSFTLPYSDKTLDVSKDTRNKPYMRTMKKILVVEDSELKYNYVKEILGQKYEIIQAISEEFAIQSFILEHPDLVLVDIHTDGMKGTDIMKRIRTMSNSIPIVGITSNNYYLEQRLAMGNGCNEVIAYPFSASKLEEMILVYI